MFSVLSSRMEQKKAIENRTPVYFFLLHKFFNFLSIFGHFCCLAAQFQIFLQFVSGVKKYDWSNVIHTVVLAYLQKKSNIYILREICKRTHCPPIGTLALLLFIFGICDSTRALQSSPILSKKIWKNQEKISKNHFLCEKRPEI